MADTTTPKPEPVKRPPSRARVFVYDTNTKQKLSRPVPASWLDGRFPHLKEQPSKKAGN